MSNEWNRNSILELVRGFQRSRIILTAVELGIFELLESGEMSADDVAERLRGDQRGVSVLLDSLAALELLRKEEGRYSLPGELVPLLTEKTVETSVLPMLRHSANMWIWWSNLTDIVRSGYVKPLSPDDERKNRQQKDFIEAMHTAGTPLAESFAARLDLAGSHRLLDIGGGSGIYTIAFLQKNPHLRGILFDLPPVTGIASRFLEREGILDRVELTQGDFHVDELPRGCDLALLSAIIHMNSPDQNRELFRKILDALQPSGRLIIRDHIMEPDRTSPTDGALFAVNMLVATEGGGTYTFDEVSGWLNEAGFTEISMISGTGNMDDIVIGRKPAE